MYRFWERRGHLARIAVMMSDSELQALRADFLEWTGGFEPETDEQIATYIDGSMAADVDPSEAREALREWMRAAAISR